MIVNVLRATTACTFSTSQLPKMVRGWCALYILTWKCASLHNGMHFFDLATSKECSEAEEFCTFWLGNVLRATTACNFSSLIWPAGSAPAALGSLLFDPPEPNHWKNTVFRDFPTFSRTWIFFLWRLSLFWSSFFFSSLLFSDSSHLCFSSVHIVGSLTSKLPSIIYHILYGMDSGHFGTTGKWKHEEVSKGEHTAYLRTCYGGWSRTIAQHNYFCSKTCKTHKRKVHPKAG